MNKGGVTDKYLLYKLGAVVLCYLFFRNYHYSRTSLLIAFCISGVLQSAIAFCEKNGLLASQHSVFGVTGSFNNPGPLGGYISFCCTISIGLLFYAIKRRKKITSYLSSAAICIQLYGLYLADSRAAFLSLMPCLIWIPYSGLKQINEKNKRLLFIISIVTLLIGSFFIYQYRPASANGRMLIWRVSANMIADAPCFGHGVGSFPKEYMIYQANFFKAHPDSSFSSVADNVVYPFNEFIHIGIVYGIVGLSIMLALFCSTFINSDKGIESKIIKAGLSSLFIFSSFSYPFSVFPLLLLYPFLCGLMHGKVCYNLNITRLQIFFTLLATCILVINTSKDILFLRNISGSLATLYEKEDYDLEDGDYEKIRNNTNFNDYYATWLIQRSKTDNERLKDIHPFCESYCLLGNYYVKHKNYTLAKHYFQEASFMIPTRLKPKYNLWELYKDTGEYEKALEIAEAIQKMRLKKESTYTLKMKRRIKNYYKDEQNNHTISSP